MVWLSKMAVCPCIAHFADEDDFQDHNTIQSSLLFNSFGMLNRAAAILSGTGSETFVIQISANSSSILLA